MRELEQRFPDELAVIGVHSGKYTAERETSRIRDAMLHMDIHHPVVNDRQFRIWRNFAVRAWPTIVFIDPRGRVLGSHAGEFEAERVIGILERLIPEFDAAGVLERRPREFVAEQPSVAPGFLRYPDGIAVDGRRVAISDSGNARVLLGELDDEGGRLRITSVLGSELPGSEHEPATSFRWPHGLCFHGDTLFVADAGWHHVKAVDLRSGRMAIVAGTDRQARTRRDLDAGLLASPWDVDVIEDTLYIASAGSHQLHALPNAARAATLYGQDPETRARSLRVHSGTRAESLLDAPHAEAALAQPMGLAAHGDRIWFADSESSAVRWSDTGAEGGVHTVIGTGLFDFGDRDGTGDEVRMQHQQGICRHESGRLLVADSYNDALKWVDPATRRAETWVRELHEPGAVACGNRHAYVCDTNAHRVVSIAYDTADVKEVAMIDDVESS